MRISDFLTEAASSILYHYTNVVAALDILKSGNFKLSSVSGNTSEESFSPKGYPYFLSLARTKMGDYSKYSGPGSTMFVLDGSWFNNNYVVKPIDYWSDFDRSGRHRESEDRVFSKKNEIPNDAIKEIHVFLEKYDEKISPRVRELFILGKQDNIKIFLYNDSDAFRILNTKKSIPIADSGDILSGSTPLSTRTKDEMMGYQEIYKSQREKEGKKGLKQFYDRDSTITGLVELLQKNDTSHLTKRATKELHNLLYYVARDLEWGREKDAERVISVDFFNAKKPNSRDYEYAVILTDFMRKNNMSLLDFIKFIIDKWKKIKGQ